MTQSTTFPFHDGYLLSLSVEDGSVILGLKQSRGDRFNMTLEGLESLSIDGFREGNIIIDLWSISGKRPEATDVPTDEVAETMEILFPGPHPSAAAQYHKDHAAFIEGKLIKVASGDATLVFMNPAYGADLYAFCASIDLQPIPGAAER